METQSPKADGQSCWRRVQLLLGLAQILLSMAALVAIVKEALSPTSCVLSASATMATVMSRSLRKKYPNHRRYSPPE